MKKSKKSAEQPAPAQQEQQQMQQMQAPVPPQNIMEVDDPALKPDVVRHNLEMQRIKAKMISDVAVELIKAHGIQADPIALADTAVAVANQALGY